jgi:hypothetical protein
MNRSYSFFLFLALMFLAFFARVVVAQPVSYVDVFPLAVGNQWTYRYEMENANLFQDIFTSELGTARYTILNRVVSQDSTRWVFEEFRDVAHCIDFIYPPGRDTCYQVRDSLQFEIVEMHEGRHRLYRQAMFYSIWPSVLPFSQDLTDTTAIYRYQMVDSTLTHTFETHTPGEYPQMTFFLAFRKDTGVVSTNAETRFLTGSMLTTDHHLLSAVITGVDEGSPQEVPGGFRLDQNYPNPFNPSTVIRFQVPRQTDGAPPNDEGGRGQASSKLVTLRIYDVLGREVATLVNERKEAGVHSVTWDATGVAGGIYFYRLQAGWFAAVKKMVVLK